MHKILPMSNSRNFGIYKSPTTSCSSPKLVVSELILPIYPEVLFQGRSFCPSPRIQEEAMPYIVSFRGENIEEVSYTGVGSGSNPR